MHTMKFSFFVVFVQLWLPLVNYHIVRMEDKTKKKKKTTNTRRNSFFMKEKHKTNIHKQFIFIRFAYRFLEKPKSLMITKQKTTHVTL